MMKSVSKILFVFSILLISHQANAEVFLSTLNTDPCEIEGTECDDNDACTINDVFNSNCNCEGTYLDTDQDGTCDAQDECPEDGLDLCNIPEGCHSIGLNSTFEYIANVKFHTMESSSGNNNGYKEFDEFITKVIHGQDYIIDLTPGYASGEYLEAWNIWIDFNKDGIFDNDQEWVTSIIGSGKQHSSISIPNDDNIIGTVRMRIAMQYNTASLPCENVTFGEVEDYYINIQSHDIENPCKEIINSDFELGYQTWKDGGSDCSRLDNNSINGHWSIRLRDNSSTSILTSKEMDLSGYNELSIDFKYAANSMEDAEDFWLQISTDGGNHFSTIRSWISGSDFENGKIYQENIFLSNQELTDNVQIRFRCDASANADQIYLDDIVINACSSEELKDEPEYLTEEETIATENDLSNPRSPQTRFQELESEKINIEFSTYPNPAIDMICFRISQLPANVMDLQIRMIDLNGETLRTISDFSSDATHSIHVNDIPKGMYVVIFENKNKILASQKVMIIK